MKKTVLILSMCVAIAMSGSVPVSAQAVHEAVVIGAGGTFTGAGTGLPLIDNFNTKNTLNNLNGGTGAFASENATCTSTIEDGEGVSGSAGLKIDYDVRTANTYSGYFSSLKGVSFDSYGVLSFKVRGEVGGEYFKIQLGTNTGTYTSAAVMINDALGGSVTTSWQTVEVPLLNFFNLADIANMKEVVFVFENVQSSVNGSSLQGTVYIDDIEVTGSANPSELMVDAFSDRVGVSAVGGNIAAFANAGSSASMAYDGAVGTLTYSVATNGYAGMAVICGGGTGLTGEEPQGWQPVERTELLEYAGVRLRLQPTTSEPKAKVNIKVKIAGFENQGWLDAFMYIDPTKAVQDLSFDAGFETFLYGTLVVINDFENQVTAINGEVGVVVEYLAGQESGTLDIDSISFIS